MITKRKELTTLNLELRKLSFGKVIEIKDLTRQKSDILFDSYNEVYIAWPYREKKEKFQDSLFFELNPYKNKIQEK